MGIDTTPGPDNPDPEGRDYAPRWFLVLVVVIVAVGGLWFLWSFFNMSGTLWLA